MRYAALLLGFLAVALAVVVATGAYRPSSEPSALSDSQAAAATAASPVDLGGGDLVLGGRAGDLAVGLSVERRPRDQIAVSATILSPDGRRARGLNVAFNSPGAGRIRASACGDGCYRAPEPISTARVVSVTVLRTGGSVSASFEIPESWKAAGPTVARLAKTFRSLRSVEYVEHLDSGQGHAIDTRWRMAAPNRLAYAISGGAAGIAIGPRRWDRPPGGAWTASRQTPIRVPEPPWGIPTDASLIGSETDGGRNVSIVSFRSGADLPVWFTVWIDDRTSRPLKLTMTTAAHFMTQQFVSFDQPVRIVAPR